MMSSVQRSVADAMLDFVVPDVDLDLMTTLSILSNQRRVDTIRVLAQFEEGHEMTLGDLAERVAEREYGIDRNELPHDKRKNVYVSLYQTHYERLADVGILEIEDEDRTDPIYVGSKAQDYFRILRLMELGVGDGC